MAKWRVLVTSEVVDKGSDGDRLLQAAGVETVFNRWHGNRTEDELIAILQGMDGVVAGLDPFTARVIGSSDRLKVIARTGVGYDAVDVPAATERGIAVCSNPGVNKRSVAEYAMGLILACSRKLYENLSVVRAGGFERHQGVELSGRTLGIMGLGSIGKEVAKRASGFDMKILAYDVYKDEAFAEKYGVTYVPLEQLLAQSDFVTLHLFLDSTTRHLINAERLSLMKPTAYLVNTARGGIVDQEALYQALKEKKIAGAALDVFENEPLEADSPLRTLYNAYLSPHVAAWSWNVLHASGLMGAENVLRILRGEKPLSIVNPEVLG